MRAYAILVLCLMGVASATAASTAVKAVESKDIIDDALALFDWAVGLLEIFDLSILDILAQFLPADLLSILQILVDLGVIPAAKRTIVDDLLAAIQLIIDEGLAAFEQLLDLIPPEILAILQALFDLGLFPSRALGSRQDITEWLMALIDVLIQTFGTEIHDLLVQVAADIGIPAFFIDLLWDLVVPATFVPSKSIAVRQDIIEWAIQLLQELGLEALAQLAEFIPAELLAILVDLVLGIGLPAAH